MIAFIAGVAFVLGAFAMLGFLVLVSYTAEHMVEEAQKKTQSSQFWESERKQVNG